MKKLASITLIAAGVLLAERIVLRIYAIWWVRWYPLESTIVTDGLGRQLVPVPKFAGVLFGRDGVWSRDMLLVDFWQITAMALCSYILVRMGAFIFEKSVLRGRA